MSAAFQPIGTDCAVVVSRAGESWTDDVQIRASNNFSRTLRTDEIGQLAGYLALIYFMRTGKMPWSAAELAAQGGDGGKPRTQTVNRMFEEPAKVVRYFYHPESDCLMVVDDDTDLSERDPLVEEIDEAMYEELRAKQREANMDPDDLALM